MASFIPDIEIVKGLATEEEKKLIGILEGLGADYEVFYQPPTQIAHADVAVLKQGAGMMLIEVYDADISGIEVKNENGHEYYISPVYVGKRISPFSAVLSYKKEFYNLLSEELFNASIGNENNNQFGLIKTAVYMPNSTLSNLINVYKGNDNLDRRKYQKYTWAFVDTTDGWTRQKIEEELQDNPLFTDEIYQSLKRALSGNWQDFILRNNIDFKKFDYQAERKLYSKSSLRTKIRGVAGSGKTMFAVQRAIVRYRNTRKPVLILCYFRSLKMD